MYLQCLPLKLQVLSHASMTLLLDFVCKAQCVLPSTDLGHLVDIQTSFQDPAPPAPIQN